MVDLSLDDRVHGCGILAYDVELSLVSQVTSIQEFTSLDAQILKSYKEDRMDWCHHVLAVEVTAKRLNVSEAMVESVVRRLFTESSII